MKKITLILIIILSFNGYSQNLSYKKLNKLSKLNIDYSKFNVNDSNIQKDFNQILKLDKKREKNKTFAVMFSSLAAVGIIGGAILIQQGKKNQKNYNSEQGHQYEQGHNFEGIIGGLGIASGIICGGISIPFWVFNKKRKKQRDLILNQYKR